MFEKILIANRGEIAVRIIRTCRDMGIKSVSVFSDADRGAPHVRMADEAYHIGPAPAAESYLAIDRVLDAASRSGADAVHPGYGFLAENPAFARAVQESGIGYIGPSPESIALMGSKLASRRAVADHGVGTIPGTDAIRDDGRALEAARGIGFPVMLKASAGGGGKGLRVVHSPEAFADALRITRTEAKAAFGDDAVFVEKALERPRHVEIQVLADLHGNAVHLGERECSIQRRHQKVIEESPSPFLDTGLRERMGDAALRVVAAAGYVNAGTVEFLVDRHRNFYFLEMNTRLQVEHPVTEAVTGMDLVRWQIRIAAGERLDVAQSEITLRGAAIECRIYAEDPEKGFLPSPGRIESLRSPSGPGIRDDSGVCPGWTVPVEYDPLLSKLVAWGTSRSVAIERMKRALGEYRITGIRHNIDFFLNVFANKEFLSGDYDTGFIDRWPEARTRARKKSAADTPAGEAEVDRDLDLALIVAGIARKRPVRSDAGGVCPTPKHRWKQDGRRRGIEPFDGAR